MRIKVISLMLFFACFLYVTADDRLKRGLFFQSFEVDKDKRTSLDLTPDKSLVFNKGFSMEFDIKLRRDGQTFGYVFRIICNDTLNVDFLVDITSGMANFTLVTKNQTVIQYNNAEIGNTVVNKWIKVLFVFDTSSNRISLSLNGITKDVIYPIEHLKKFNLYFGGSKHRDFFTTDVTPMTIKDIRFFDEKQELVRHWELTKHSLNYVHDECVSSKAIVQNPIWEIDRHAKWNKKETLICQGQRYHIAFDRNGGRFYFANDKTIFIYNLYLQKVDTINDIAGIPFNCNLANLLLYDSNRHELVSYDIENRRLAIFDFSTCQWNNNDNSMLIQRYLHHSQIFIAEDSLLITFGGYGFHRYNSRFYRLQVAKNVWDMTNLSQSITPRYLGSIGLLENRELLYFGGFGNESGVQEEFPRNYYDLYSINIDNASVKKIWELSNPIEHFTNSNSLVVDKDNGKFYALAYPNKRYASVIKLHEYSLIKPEYRTVGDSILYSFNDIESYCNLFQSADTTELYAITSSVSNNTTEINIYSIAFPALSIEEIIQHQPSQSNGWIWFWMVALSGLIGVFGIFRKKQNKRTVKESAEVSRIVDNKEEPVIYSNLSVEKQHSSINLLGNFRILDNAGNDITKNFTPTTTQFFLLLLISTINNQKGVSPQQLWKILWFDKDYESARNNRNVYINRLRSIFKSFEEIKIVNTESYWTIQTEKTVFCDYERILILIKTLKTNNIPFYKNLLTELVDTALKGTLLPYIQQSEWIEHYQSEYTNQLIECLMKYSNHDEVKTDLLLLLKMADTILLHDNIDEDGIKLKCYALFRLGRKNQALQVFNKFTSDYENLLATKHNLVFEELVK